MKKNISADAVAAISKQHLSLQFIKFILRLLLNALATTAAAAAATVVYNM